MNITKFPQVRIQYQDAEITTSSVVVDNWNDFQKELSRFENLSFVDKENISVVFHGNYDKQLSVDDFLVEIF